VELESELALGMGYTYSDAATAHFLIEHAIPLLADADSKDHFQVMEKFKKKCRNLGNAGISSMANSALDIAFWDLRARELNISIQELIGKKRESIPFYGSGLFINNSEKELLRQVDKFKKLGMNSFKMKIGLGLENDIQRVKMVRQMVGEQAELFVDANGAYTPKEGLALADALTEFSVTWFEEPITSDDEKGMKFLREHFPQSVAYVAGEYCNQQSDFLHLLSHGLVDIIQADATRSEGVSGTLAASHLANAFNIPLSTHCAPLLHGNLAASLDQFKIAECFYDHLRLEEELFTSVGKYEKGNFIPSSVQDGFGWGLSPESQGYLVYEYAA
jgi:L-alanine-DL-glutamate epimerase-like enolase superfamily enzyme